MQSSDEWGQNYINTMPEFSFDEAFDVPDHPPHPTDTTSSPKVSANGDSLFPRGSIGKPVRRRSRASKKSPTTLLTADAHNFRALVQQFTGCHSVPPAFGVYKGPINLNFERSSHFLGEPEGSSDRSLFSFGGDDATGGTATTTAAGVEGDRGLFVSRVNDDRRPESLTLDDFNVDNLSMEEMSVTGDCSTGLPGTGNDDFWGY